MSAQFTPSILAVKVKKINNFKNVISEVEYKLTASIDDAEYSLNFPVEIEFSEDGFKEFEAVSESDVILWAEAAIGQERLQSLKNGADAMLKAKLAQTDDVEPVIAPLPWSIQSETKGV
jgi:isopentenyl diphosphate isomerase/L-lactate dehydrogenase-like FMN-dependent dehydrogenase